MSSTSDTPKQDPVEEVLPPVTSDELPDTHQPLPQDFETQLLKLMVQELLRRLASPKTASKMSAQEMNLIRQLCQDNTVGFASIKRGDFGETAKRIAEEFPFDPQGNVVSIANG